MTKQADGTRDRVVEVLDKAAAEMAEHKRGRHYMFWRQDNEGAIDTALASAPPFNAYRDQWIFSGDGGGAAIRVNFGGWAIDQLVSRRAPTEIIAMFEAEVARNVGDYTEVSPLFGVQIDAECTLDEGLTIEPEHEELFARMMQANPFQHMTLPSGTALLRQSYTVTPAFARQADGPLPASASSTAPPSSERDAARRLVRLACLLAGAGAVELPLSVLEPRRDACLVAGKGNSAGRPHPALPLVSFAIKAREVSEIFARLRTFREFESIARAIDRLGRARLATSDVDKALDLGMAAEIALMHDHGSSNTEIRYKVGHRAAWLLGSDAVERATIFEEMRALYDARSSAVHTGTLGSRTRVDLTNADALVTRALRAIVALGRFPDWSVLTMGGGQASD